MIGRVEEQDNAEVLTERWRQPLPVVRLEGLAAERYVDALEETVTAVGWALMHRLWVEQWRLTDQALVAAYRQRAGGQGVTDDGYESLKVVSRVGVLQLPRQVCDDAANASQVLPGKTALPVYEGSVTTRGLQEWACLLPQEAPFSTAQRLLGWLTREPAVLSATQLRRWVKWSCAALVDSLGLALSGHGCVPLLIVNG